MRSIIAIFITTFCLLLSSPRAYALCDESSGGGAVFYKFDKIVIYFLKFPHPDVQKLPNYPDELKFENFSKALTEAVKENFAPCLKRTTFLGKPQKDKPIIITKEFTDDTFDPDSLTIIVAVRYNPPPPENPKAEWNYGVLHFTMFRSGLSKKDSIRPLMYYNYAEPFFPYSKSGNFNKRLESFFKMIEPQDFSTEYLKNHPEYRGADR